jgi:predicted GNAT family N-acyltransferase
VRALRRAVFVFEQGVSLAEEIDDLDARAQHLAATLRGRVVGTCRLFDEGRTWRLTRMAVERPLRGSGVGALLLGEAHRMAESAGADEMVLSAQISAREFYTRHGYRTVGETYMDAGIEHVSMRRSLDAVQGVWESPAEGHR